MKRYILIPSLIATMFMMNTCAVNPVTGKKQVVLMSEEQEIAMGKEADPQIIAQYGLYEDKALQDFINQKGKAMAAVSHRPSLDYHFRIVDSEVINAFAVPGGYVYFTRGIMAHFNDEAQFAGVLGHEIGHITARHSVIQQRNAMLGQIGLIAGMVISPEFGQFAQQASQGLGLLFLKFGRDDERQSDQLGVEYSSKIGYDAQQMADFFTTLERSSARSGAEELPDFLSSHPNPGSRNATVTKLAAEWQQKLSLNNPQVNRNSYLQRINGMIYGEDPKQGFVENSAFYHPVLKFQFQIPSGWAHQNSPQTFQMAPRDGKAMMMLTMAPGKSLQEAANAVLQQNQLTVVESRETTVNGLRAIAMVADQRQEQGTLRTLSYLIQYGDAIYLMLGVSNAANFNAYSQYFSNTMQSFKQLTDAAKLNKKPERVRIKTVSSATTLEQALRTFGAPAARLEEFAILNGMTLKDRLPAGTLIKVISE
ncbi:M48 family metalloprotease [Paradesertivirga mongoliensis]|uniref:M48 family metalloprotease n=1 Tax=Paradesertivirga mongoliensis TaxID=2100740 RepID=A0ABW4ZMP3_9SPHI|nr:M48 family metalloprotease [Pedobacter mongoliensis]